MAKDIKKIAGVYAQARDLSSSALIGDSSLKAYYKFDNNLTVDSSGKGNTLTVVGTPTSQVGKFDGAVLTNGSNRLTISSNFGLSNTHFSISCWVKIVSNNQMGSFCHLGDSGSNGFGFYQNGNANNNTGNYLSLLFGGVAFVNTGVQFPNTTEYHHTVITRGGSTTRLYLNGKLVYTTTTTPGVPSTSFRTTHTDPGSFNLDEVTVFGKALSGQEVYDLYSTGVKSVNGVKNIPDELNNIGLKSTAGLRAYYRLEGNANDSSGNGYNGTAESVSYGTSYGKFGQGASFNGSSSNIRVTNNLGIASKVISMGCWVKLNSEISSGDWCFLQHANNTTDTFITLSYQVSSGVRRIHNFMYKLSPDVLVPITYNINLGTSRWTHLCTVSDGTTFYLYVDGVNVGSASVPPNGSYGFEDSFNIGRNYLPSVGSGPNQYANAQIDDVFVFNRALSSAEIMSIFTSTKKVIGISNI